MPHEPRIERLLTALTPRERALLALAAFKAKKAEPAWSKPMQPSQAREYNRYLALIDVANIQLAALITVIEKEVEKLQLRLAWLYSMRLWQRQLAQISLAASLLVREPITQSDYNSLVAAEAERFLMVGEAAALLANEQGSWSDADLEDLSWLPGPMVSKDAWRRLCAAAEGEIRQAAADGALTARGNGKKLQVQRGSLEAWYGQPIPITPAWAAAYDLRPDAETEGVEQDEQTLAYLCQALQAPHGLDAEVLSHWGNLASSLEARLSEGVAATWTDLRVAELMVWEIATTLDDQDPLRPVLRKSLDSSRQRLQELAEYLAEIGAGGELPEPSEADLRDTRAWLERAQKLYI